MKVLLTGAPRSGKSLLVRRLAEEFPGNCGGILVAEIRGGNGRRCGFELQIVWSAPGKPLEVVDRATLARTGCGSALRSGRYRVDLEALRLGVAALDAVMHEGGLVLIDEIGPLEILSAEFRDAVLRCVQGQCSLLGTISPAEEPFLDTVRAMPAIRLVEVNRHNRNYLAEGLKSWICPV